MRENSKNTSHNFEDDDDIIPDMRYPHWVSRFEKPTLTRGRPKTRDAQSLDYTPLLDVSARAASSRGAGWQSRINDALRQWLSDPASDT